MIELCASKLRNAKTALKTVYAYSHDAYRFYRHSNIAASISSEESLRAKMVKAYHAIEKGLSYTDFRAGFGKQIVETACKSAMDYTATYGWTDELSHCYAALVEYRERSAACLSTDKCTSDTIARACNAILKAKPASQACDGEATKQLSAAAFTAAERQRFYSFFTRRVSVREFSRETIDIHDVYSALETAIRTPSVCNRQAWNAHIFSGREDVEAVLKFQDGNRGFGHNVPCVVLITATVAAMQGIRERNQCWIDGGMFSMSAVLALHSHGYGTCCLNLCINPTAEKGLRKTVGYAEAHVPIMMIAVGHPAEHFSVPTSARRDASTVIRIATAETQRAATDTSTISCGVADL